MQKDTLKVGTSNGEFYVKAEVDMPETLTDCARLAKCSNELVGIIARVEGSPEFAASAADKTGRDYLVAKFTRGYRIDLQEGGARQVMVEKLAGKSAAQAMKDESLLKQCQKDVEAEIKAFDPAKPRARATRSAAPQTVVVEDRTYTAAEMMALLAGLKGVKVETK